ncbi:hypothetical protein [Campylobacter geochelonis]|uniref:Small hydrophobic protein n=1 Tax=Campylobacter geochelonis TaxID=1780362 RepID=A0A128EFK5_9BACT|nr:hypothetical protein [Campylobacter geochelonis]QKF71048.1 DsbI-accessory protein Dba [Campylobacter geochelonis]CZE47217.1 small hydrophobic protein [Campylobacter geochelonis]CZE47690.1 small hydrophobic protein [Campylobacter geochelonis]CZE50136.1 small hydrophobic protein [Campylobacter geochelonis]
MEFLGLILAFIAVFLVYKIPKKENLAFGIFVIAWILAIIMYMGDTSSLLPNMNL